MEKSKKYAVKLVAAMLFVLLSACILTVPTGAVFAEEVKPEPMNDGGIKPPFVYDSYFIEKGEVDLEDPPVKLKFYNINAIWIPWKDDVTVEAIASGGGVLRGYVAVTMYNNADQVATFIDVSGDHTIQYNNGVKIFTLNGEKQRKMTTHSTDYMAAYARIEVFLDNGAYHKTFLLLMPNVHF